MAYADCGTYGKLDEFCEANNIPRLPGLHCYDVFAGPEVIAKLFDEEPGTYLLTDYLVRTFDKTVLASLGLDKHPELWPDYFAHYKRVIWLAQAPTPTLEAEAQRIATLFGLPLTTIPTGLGGLESALAGLLRTDAEPVEKGNDTQTPEGEAGARWRYDAMFGAALRPRLSASDPPQAQRAPPGGSHD
jgi:hypothetical protein